MGRFDFDGSHQSTAKLHGWNGINLAEWGRVL